MIKIRIIRETNEVYQFDYYQINNSVYFSVSLSGFGSNAALHRLDVGRTCMGAACHAQHNCHGIAGA